MYLHICISIIKISSAFECLAAVGWNRGNITLAVDHQMDDFDPYAEPKFDFEQTKSPPALRLQGASRLEKVESRAEFQDIDPHVTLSYNGLLPIFLGGTC